MVKTYKSTVSNISLKAEKSDFQKVKITQSSDAADFIRQFYGDDLEIYESFFLVLLNRANATTGYVKISQGGTAGTVVDVKIVAKYAVESLSAGVILAHNHPSGETRPSKEDENITHRITKALELFGIKVVDHIIIGPENSYFSFEEHGMLTKYID
jgi:DNA repair protein RadC